ncbi:hypothetical protein OG730_15000 [Streptomyces sp. NBC_01298]|uniref:hypothetical protein n=1 Tax=Streptomyces sp. NBC_01298 TaxID=2903817 RepID=UPI002E0FF248|nr:hypothetical protein OG730_15000 [Streptomyces sp. NBC_01298]
MTAIANDLRTGRSLVEPELFDSITQFVLDHFGETDRGTAEEITDQAIAFLATVGGATVKMVPSDSVDKGVHAFTLHTRDIDAFAEIHAGRRLHHNPRPGGGPRLLEDVQGTTRAMKAAGFMVIDRRWTVNGKDGAQCDSDCGRDYRAA